VKLYKHSGLYQSIHYLHFAHSIQIKLFDQPDQYKIEIQLKKPLDLSKGFLKFKQIKY